jgi:tRNA 2-thiouridine synthesizing protein A
MSEVVVKELDTSGLSCPLPILRLKQTLGTIESGQRLRVIATDPGSQSDFAAFAAQTGHRLVESCAEGGKFIYVVEKK